MSLMVRLGAMAWSDLGTMLVPGQSTVLSTVRTMSLILKTLACSCVHARFRPAHTHFAARLSRRSHLAWRASPAPAAPLVRCPAASAIRKPQRGNAARRQQRHHQPRRVKPAAPTPAPPADPTHPARRRQSPPHPACITTTTLHHHQPRRVKPAAPTPAPPADPTHPARGRQSPPHPACITTTCDGTSVGRQAVAVATAVRPSSIAATANAAFAAEVSHSQRQCARRIITSRDTDARRGVHTTRRLTCAGLPVASAGSGIGLRHTCPQRKGGSV